jgi:anthranilate synthase component 1
MGKKYKLQTRSKKLLADTLTPVNIYLKVRDVFSGSILLESSDYHGHENSLSFICCDPFASFQVKDEMIEMRFPGPSKSIERIAEKRQVLEQLENFRLSFEADDGAFNSSGMFGYMAYDAVRYFEDIDIDITSRLIPDIVYKVYRYVMVVDHFSNELTLYENSTGRGETAQGGLEKLEQIIYSNRFPTYSFHLTKEETSNITDEAFLDMTENGIRHCLRGNVFQVVLSRRFTSGFLGDEFNVYRALRSVNPSPYLFYFDFGSFRIFGSSPEAQIQIKGKDAAIFPIAGTFKRSGNDQDDLILANNLMADEKENAEHVMLVDLARNDLSRGSGNVAVEVFKEVQYYSHVIHLVSKVTGRIGEGASSLNLVSDTFPAGTLSGAPKHRAMSIINASENVNRSFYGGAIGFIGFNGDVNLAIMIRTFLSKDQELVYQAGAGIVAKSSPQSELQEVNNKLGALRRAMVMAERL